MRRTILAAIPYYEATVYWEGGSRRLYVEAYLSPRLPAMLRAVLVSPRREGLEPVPPPGHSRLRPEPPEAVSSSIEEAFRLILESREARGPPFEFEGLKGLIKAVITFGRYKPYRPTGALLARSAYNYVHDILGLPVPPRVSPGRLLWKPIRAMLENRGEGPFLVSLERLEGEAWRPDRLLMRLASEAPTAFKVLVEDLWRLP